MIPSGLKRLRENVSFAPSGLVNLTISTHGLRRGLHSVAALRLNIRGHKHLQLGALKPCHA
jgi:hypothetical protein